MVEHCGGDFWSNWPQKCFKYFSAKFAAYEIRPRANGCRLIDLTPCKRGSPLQEWLPALKIIYFYFRYLKITQKTPVKFYGRVVCNASTSSFCHLEVESSNPGRDTFYLFFFFFMFFFSFSFFLYPSVLSFQFINIYLHFRCLNSEISIFIYLCSCIYWLLLLCWCFTAFRHFSGHFGRGQLTYPLCSGCRLTYLTPCMRVPRFKSGYPL